MNKKIEKEFAPSSWAIKNSTSMYVLMGIILFLGIKAYFNMPREDYPEIKENLVFVSSIYPGNTAEDVEKLITEPIEDKLKALNNIEKITSTSEENLSLIIIEFNDKIGFTDAKLKVKDELGVAKVKVTCGSDGETAIHNIELNVRMPNPMISKVIVLKK